MLLYTQYNSNLDICQALLKWREATAMVLPPRKEMSEGHNYQQTTGRIDRYAPV